MSNIIPFEFEGSAVRSIIDEDGQPWFVGKDVCECLDIKGYRRALAALDDRDRKGVRITDPLGKNPQTMTVINEAGVYQLIFTSRTEAAKRFKRWLAHEVLPTIRKTGGYSVVDNGDALTVDLQRSYTVCEVIIRPDGQWGRIWAIPVYRIQGVDYWNVPLVLEAYSGQRRIPDNVDLSEYARDLMHLHPELMGAAPLWVACLERLEMIVKLVGGCWDDRARQFLRDLATAMPSERMAIGSNLILPHSPTHH